MRVEKEYENAKLIEKRPRQTKEQHNEKVSKGKNKVPEHKPLLSPPPFLSTSSATNFDPRTL